MKLTSILSSLALLAFASTGLAQQTIEITGATAFRVGAIKSIIALYQTGTLTDIAHSGTTTSSTGHEGANDAIFRGTIPGTTGTTVVRCSWNGSVEGVNAVANSVSENYLTIAAFSGGATYAPVGPDGLTVLPTAGGQNYRYNLGNAFAQAGETDSEMAFSDVFGTSTPYNTSALSDTIVGILPFFAVINDGAPATYTNMQAQKFGQLAIAGFLPARFLFPTTSTTNVFLTGRNDGSGTRSTYLAIAGTQPGQGRNQSQVGPISTPILQWRPAAPVSDEIPSLRQWPTGDGTNASTVWGPDAAGNGGYASGSTVADRLAAKTTSVQRQNAATGANIGTPGPLHLVSVVGLSDAVTAIAGGGRALAWDGASVNVTATLDATETAKFYNGSYTLWSYEHLFGKSLTAAEQVVHNGIVSLIPTYFGSSGIDPLPMLVERLNDGTDLTIK